LPFSGDVAFSTTLRDVLRTVLLPISRRGEVLSESELKVCIMGGAGDPSAFFDSAPRAKRPARLRSTDAFGGEGMGDDPFWSGADTVMGIEYVGVGISTDDAVGVVSTCSGVF
jgi:hypothetical protein